LFGRRFESAHLHKRVFRYPQIPVLDLSEKYLTYIATVRRYSKRTCAVYRDILSDFHKQYDDLTTDTVRNYEVYLLDERKLDARTVDLHLSVLSGYCRFLVRANVLKTNPVSLVKRPKQEKRLPEFYRQEAMEEYFSQNRGVMQYAPYEHQLRYMIISILSSSAIRRSELIDMNNCSYDRGRRVLRVRGKGDKMREIPITEALNEEISLYLQSKLLNEKCSDAPGAPLLQTPDGNRLYPVFVDRAVKQELGTVGSISGRRSPHVLRHTLATELLNDGADLNSIKEFLGHSSLAATQVYTHNSVEKLKKVYELAHPRAKNGGKNGN